LGIDKIAEKIKKLFSPTSKLHIVNSIEMLPSDVEQEGEMLHGSALIFSHLFIERYDGLNSDTFMYGEESILDFIAKRDKLRCIYCPALKILHKDDSSTNYVYKRNRLKRRFYLKNLIKSMEVLRNLMIDVQYGNS
jgi:GT2 family glycosyltransferase